MNKKDDTWLISIICLSLVVFGGCIFFFGDSIISRSSFGFALKIVFSFVGGIIAFAGILVVIGIFVKLFRRLIYRSYLRRLDHKEPSRRLLLTKPIIACYGLILFAGGLYLIYGSRVKNDFLGAFFSVTGAQIFLWAIGIKFEILANVPSNFRLIKKDKNGDGASPNVDNSRLLNNIPIKSD